MTRAALVLVAALALAGSASAGGFATVQLGATPYGVATGGTWSTDLTVLQHGRTPLDGLSPTVTISNGTQERVFPAVATGRTGVYHVEVVFPSAGTWTWKIWDGFTRTHTYAPVVVGATDDGPGTVDASLGWWIVGLVAAAALVAATALARRRPRPRPA